MCQYHTCYHDENIGYVIRCEACQRLQLGFGNIMMGFTPGQFAAFRQLVAEHYDQPLPPERRRLKYIIIPLPSDRIRLLLSRHELDGLYKLLEAADSEIIAMQLMQLFRVNTKRG